MYGLPWCAGALVYIATPDKAKNVNWLGPAPLAELAAQIVHAVGPSGPNTEYLYKLAAVMRQVIQDELQACCCTVLQTRLWNLSFRCRHAAFVLEVYSREFSLTSVTVSSSARRRSQMGVDDPELFELEAAVRKISSDKGLDEIVQ